jgi:hypothetical protein
MFNTMAEQKEGNFLQVCVINYIEKIFFEN